jgi:hypothetical protein
MEGRHSASDGAGVDLRGPESPSDRLGVSSLLVKPRLGGFFRALTGRTKSCDVSARVGTIGSGAFVCFRSYLALEGSP